jgi:putative heme-binding domain-containing protein
MTLHPDSEIRSESREILGIDPDQDSSPEALLAKYSPAIGSHGDPDVGRTIHETRCATCHRLRGAGFQVGPDLESVVAGGRETILLNIINPDREVNPIYMGHTVTDASDETFTGIVTAINAEVFTLRQASALDQVFHFDEIKSLEKHTQSFMPQGLLQGLSIEEVSGLLDYITGSGPSSAKN